MNKIKNIAIIAHVDHGKTTLVDSLLKQTGNFRDNQNIAERVMDSNDLEREKGITIFSKNASLSYKDYVINFVDTPGHADFGGEVQRIMRMVDSVLLLVDAFEGVMPQTRYVLKNALELNLKPIVVINKIDRPMARPEEILDQIFDLFVDLNATDDQLDFPVVYASAKQGIAKYNLESENKDLTPLLEQILTYVPDASGDKKESLQLLVSSLDSDNYVGKIVTGKIENGIIEKGKPVLLCKKDGSNIKYNITKIYQYQGLNRIETEKASAGDIISVAGIEKADIGESLCSTENPKPLPVIEIDKPTLSMIFRVNDSPMVGKDGKWVTGNKIWERLEKEIQTNVSLKIYRTSNSDQFEVRGRGELQLAILIENMRREGYEFAVSRPQAIIREIDGKKMEPIELLQIDVDENYAGIVIEKLGGRKGELISMSNSNGSSRLQFHIPARGLLGFSSEFLSISRGSGVMNHSFLNYTLYKGEIPQRNKGALVALDSGNASAYSLWNLQDRGIMFVSAGDPIYKGMVVGEHNKPGDLDVNVVKNKKLTNVRASGSDDAMRQIPPRLLSLEQALEYITDDELVEVTPNSMRLRKKFLDPKDRIRNQKRIKSSI